MFYQLKTSYELKHLPIKKSNSWLDIFWGEFGMRTYGRLRIGSTQSGETGSVRILSRDSWLVSLTPTWSWRNVWSSMSPVFSHWTLRWRLKNLFQTTRAGFRTVSLTPNPSLNPKMTLTKFLRNLVWHRGYPFSYFYVSSSHLCNLNMLCQGIPQPFQIDVTRFIKKKGFFYSGRPIFVEIRKQKIEKKTGWPWHRSIPFLSFLPTFIGVLRVLRSLSTPGFDPGFFEDPSYFGHVYEEQPIRPPSHHDGVFDLPLTMTE